jgi:hypothetical protein
MPSVNYNYQISTSCPHGVNIDALAYEIRISEIKHSLHYIYVDNDADLLYVWFRSELDTTDQDVLEYLVANHKGLPLSMPTTMSGISLSMPDYSRNLIIDTSGDGIGVSPQMPFYVQTYAISSPHDLSGTSHSGILDDSQIPDSIARYIDLLVLSGTLNADLTNFYTITQVNTIASGLAAWDHDHDLRYIRINNQSVIDHGLISGLNDNDHPQYLLGTDFTIYSGTLQSQINNRSIIGHTHDDRYYTETELDNGQLDNRYYTESELATGQLDSRYYTESEINTISGVIAAKIITDHGALGGLGDDDHTQYLNITRGDARYYTEAEVDTISGTLNTRIYNNFTTLSGIDVSNYNTLNSKIDTASGTLQYEIDHLPKHHGDLSGLGDDDHPQYHTDARGDTRYLQLVGGTVLNNLIILGNLTVSGTSFVSNTETVLIEDNTLYLNNGETASGVSEGTAGIQIDRGLAEDYLIIFDDTTDTFRAGISGSTQAVAMRGDTQTNNYLAYWNSTANRFDTTSSMLYSDVASKTLVSTTSGILQLDINGREPSFTKNTAFNKNFGSTATTVCEGNDTRLSDARLALLHGNERHTSVFITTSGVTYEALSANGDIGTSSSQVAQGDHTHPGASHNQLHAITSTADHSAGFNKVFYSNNTGIITELPLGASGTLLSSKGPTAAPIFIDAAGLQSMLTVFSGTSACCTMELASDAVLTTTGYTDVNFDLVTHENAPDVIKRDETNHDRIYVYVSGAYTISMNLTAVCNGGKRVDGRIIKNDTTVVSGTTFYLVDSSSEQIGIQVSCSLEVGDYITFQGLAAQNGDYFAAGGRVCLTRIGGMKGDKGDTGTAGTNGLPGTGSTINVSREGTLVTGSPFTNLNFQNASTVSSGTTSGTVNINLQPVFGSYFQESTVDVDDSTTAVWPGSPNNPRVRITTPDLPYGKYRIGWSYNIYCSSTTVSPQARVQINDTDTIHAWLVESKDASSNEQDAISGFYYLTSSGIKTIDLDYGSETAGTSVTIRRARLEFWRVS